MNVQQEDLKESRKKITLTLSTEDMQSYLDRAATRVSKHLKVAGFRPGHMPRDIVEKQVGEMAVLEEAAQLAVPKELERVFQEHNIRAVGQPAVQMETLAPGNDVVFSAEIDVLPDITLPDLKKLKVKREAVSVSDDDIKETLEKIQEQRASFDKVERAAKKGDQVLIDFVGRKDGAKVEGAEGEKYPLELGSGQFIPGFEDALEGVKPGGETTFKVTFPDTYQKASLQNAEVEFTVTVHEVREKHLPTLDDAFAKEVSGEESLDAFKATLKKNLTEEKTEDEQRAFEQRVVDAIIEKLGKIELPTSVVDNELGRMFQEIKEKLEQQGGTLEQYLESIGKTEEEFQKENRETAEKRSLANLVVFQALQDSGVTVSDKDVEQEQKEAVAKYEFHPQLVEHVKSDAYKEHLKNVLENRKTIAWLVEQVEGTGTEKKAA